MWLDSNVVANPTRFCSFLQCSYTRRPFGLPIRQEAQECPKVRSMQGEAEGYPPNTSIGTSTHLEAPKNRCPYLRRCVVPRMCSWTHCPSLLDRRAKDRQSAQQNTTTSQEMSWSYMSPKLIENQSIMLHWCKNKPKKNTFFFSSNWSRIRCVSYHFHPLFSIPNYFRCSAQA